MAKYSGRTLTMLALWLVLAVPIGAQSNDLSLTVLGTYDAGVTDKSAAEIVDYDPTTHSLFITNASANTIDVVDISNPAQPTLRLQISLAAFGDGVNSVAVSNGIGAAAVENEDVMAAGVVVFFDPASGATLGRVTTGVLPDMLTFTPDGRKLLVANEGQPNDSYTLDPEGSVTIIDVSAGVENLDESAVTQVTFETFNHGALDPAVRIYGPGASVAQDLEPEYIAVSPDSSTAFVVAQENNALIIIDLGDNRITAIRPLGFKDHSLAANALDASNRDGGINIAPWPVQGLYQPDALAAYNVAGVTYLLSANEGDARDYDGFSEEFRVTDLRLDASAFPNAALLQDEANLGRLKTTTALGDTDGDGDFDQIYAYGARSFTIWNSTTGDIVFDSGSDFERITAALSPANFNSNGQTDSFDDRSDDKGPEPEAITIGAIGEHSYAFIAMERVGGVFVYDISDPARARFVTYANNATIEGSVKNGTAGDVGPESVKFIAAADSPSGAYLLVVANEVSGTTTIYQLD